MLIIGHKLVNFKPFFKIMEIENIKNTPSNSTIMFQYSKENIKILKYAKQNSLNFAIKVENISQLMIANSYEASFFIVNKEFVQMAQKIADEYLFDAKILLFGEKEEDLEFAAKNFIDGIVFNEGIIQ